MSDYPYVELVKYTINYHLYCLGTKQSVDKEPEMLLPALYL